MEENNPDLTPEPEVCVNCKQEPSLQGYPTNLCAPCRQYYTKYPIPQWVYAFGVGVLAIVLVSAVKLPQYLGLAVEYGRAEKAIKNKNYVTAQRSITAVLARFPDIKEAQAYLLIAACYNEDMATVSAMYDKLEGQTIDDDLLPKVDEAIAFEESFSPLDSALTAEIDDAGKMLVPGLLNELQKVDSTRRPEENIYRYIIADKLYDLGAYDQCEKVLTDILKRDPKYYLALRLLAATDRRQQKYNEAIAACDEMLAINHEDMSAFAQKAKIEFRRGNDGLATQYANKAYAQDRNDLIALEVKAMAVYFAHKTDSAELMLATIAKKDDEEKVIYDRVERLIHGKETYR